MRFSSVSRLYILDSILWNLPCFISQQLFFLSSDCPTGSTFVSGGVPHWAVIFRLTSFQFKKLSLWEKIHSRETSAGLVICRWSMKKEVEKSNKANIFFSACLESVLHLPVNFLLIDVFINIYLRQES